MMPDILNTCIIHSMKIAHVNAIIWYLVCQYLDRYPFLIDLLTTRVSDKEG